MLKEASAKECKRTDKRGEERGRGRYLVGEHPCGEMLDLFSDLVGLVSFLSKGEHLLSDGGCLGLDGISFVDITELSSSCVNVVRVL